MVVEKGKAINKKRKEKDEDYDIKGSLYSIFTLDSFI
jgi:hypothetical protein